jgi:hypothetical protein
MVSKLIAEMTEEGVLARGENRRFILRSKARPSAAAPASNVLPGGARSNGAAKKTPGVRPSALNFVAPRNSPPAP